MRILKGFILCGSIVALQVGTAYGQTPPTLTEEEAVSLGLERNARIRAAEADAAEAAAAHDEVRAEGLPSLRTQASFTRLGGDIPAADITLPGIDTTFSLIPIERNRINTELSIEQPLFTGGRITYQTRAAARRADAAEQLAQQERVDVAFEIRGAFWNLYGALALEEATDAAVAYMDELVEDVENRFEVGAALMSDVLSARARRSEVLLERVEARNLVRTGRLELAQLIGLPLDSEIDPAPVAPLDPPPAASTEPMVPSTPRIRALMDEVVSIQAQIDATRATWLPDLSFIGRYVLARPNPYAFTEQSELRGTWEAGVLLRWSAWEGGGRSARATQARERLRAAEARLETAREQAAVELARQSLELQRAAEAVAVAAENVQQAEEAFRVTRDQFAEGMVLSAQVLEAEQAYRAAQARNARALSEYAISRAAVIHALGEI